jgi:DNA-binding NarL/FixJ family response regulator
MTQTISPAIMRAVNSYDSPEARIDALARLTGYSKTHALELLTQSATPPEPSLQASRTAFGIVPMSKPKPPSVRNKTGLDKAQREAISQRRKSETLARFAQGLTQVQIAKELGISVSTVKRFIYGWV